MTLNQLRYFCMASRCHSITKAAEELYVTQPTVSVAIRDLEIEFGVSLFSRKGNQLILTREGEEFYQKANYILQYCNELQADYSNLSRVRPPIRIGIPPMLSTVFFPELLLAFSEEHPEIAVSLEEYGSVRACNLVQDDTLDLAEYVYGHHERWDGAGYPRGLKGEQIPLLSRIIAVTETYDRVLNRGDLPLNDRKLASLDVIKNGAGTQFDPQIAELFVQIIEKSEEV